MLAGQTGNIYSEPIRRRIVSSTRVAWNSRYAVWPLALFTVLLFCQAWVDVLGFTVRAEDVLALLFVGGLLMPVILTGKLRYYRNPLNLPLVLWCGVILMGVSITLLGPFDGEIKKNALINGVRLILAVGMFFVVQRHPAPAVAKLKAVQSAIIVFSGVTTTVALLQMAHWDGWLPINLPDVLTTFKEGANTEQGREIFALYIGDTGSHTWSGALAMQALLVWLIARHEKNPWRKGAAWLYFGLLFFILIRISVRNSILGLFVTIIGLELVRRQRARDFVLGLIRPALIVIAVAITLFILFSIAPDSYFIERVRHAVPRFENGELVISRAGHLHGRLEFWATALDIFAQSPLFGGGFYSFSTLSGVYGPQSIVHAHNSYLHTLAELGLFGGGALILLLVSTSYYMLRTRRHFRLRTLGSFWWEFVTGSLLFLVFSALFSNTLWSPNHVVFRMVILAVLASLSREGTRTR